MDNVFYLILSFIMLVNANVFLMFTIQNYSNNFFVLFSTLSIITFNLSLQYYKDYKKYK